MFSIYLYKKLFSIKHLLADSTAIRHNKLVHAPNLLRSFENYIHVSYSSLVNVDLSTASTKTTDKRKKSADKLDEEKSYTVSYLMRSFGFSPERAVSISAKVRFNNSEKPNSVIVLLESYGFSNTQIAAVVRKKPVILVAKEKSILPKLEFFLSIGMSKALLAAFISKNPTWLRRSLDKLIIPNYNFLKSLLLTDERVIAAIKQNGWVFPDKCFAPNINVLRELKVPDSFIRYLLVHYPEALVIRGKEFKESVSKVLEMGFNPLKSEFVSALHVVSGNANKVTWDQCFETYSNWGWSKEDIYMAFRKHPNCMLVSQKKICGAMDFLVNRIGVNSRYIAQNPLSISFSLEKRIIPRFSVIQALLSKGLIKRFNLNTVLISAEKYFLDKFVLPYEKEIPKLYDYYKGKVGVLDL